MKKNILILFGGGGSEHDISKISANYLTSQIDKNKFNLIQIEILKSGAWKSIEGSIAVLNGKNLLVSDESFPIDCVIPCIHGFPGETGELQASLELAMIPYFGCSSKTNVICFNKALTKAYLEIFKVPTTPYVTLTNTTPSNVSLALDFYKKHSNVFVKAASQGSSVGCFYPKSESELVKNIDEAFHYSDTVLIEKFINARELEVAAFEYNQEVHFTQPGEILCPEGFYSFEEKYAEASHTKTNVKADITDEQIKKINDISIKVFKILGLRHLSRIDYFIDKDSGEVLFNEVNTFPGLTPISMFPKMLENAGVNFSEFITQSINDILDS